jgi:hypothetical protein
MLNDLKKAMCLHLKAMKAEDMTESEFGLFVLLEGLFQV